MSKTRAGCLYLLLSFSLISVVSAGTHTRNNLIVLRSYPVPAAVEVPMGTDIGITVSAPFGSSEGSFIVVGSSSGQHTGMVHYSADRTTIIFHPTTPFDIHESVNVVLTATLSDGRPVLDSFSFQTVHATISPSLLVPGDFETYSIGSNRVPAGKSSGDRILNSLGPMVDSVYSLNPTPGKVYVSVANGGSSVDGVAVLDESGNLIHRTAIQQAVFDFLPQPNGIMTYYNAGKYYGLDTSYNIVDSFVCANGYSVDEHELRVEKNGGYTILGLTLSTADLSSVGGSSTAQVQGDVIQTFDSVGNLVFEWRGIDYYNPTDALGVNFRSNVVDFEHANSIDIDSAGNYLLSNRHLSEVTKIDGKTGDIIWRLGGRHNEFTSLNDTIGFSYQHCARYLPNNHIILFDNGNLHAVAVSRAVEFALNTSNMTDSVVWQFHHNPEITTASCGSVQRLPNGNTFIGWGIQLTGPRTPTSAATEVEPDGTVVSDWYFLPVVYSYRALKYLTPAITVSAPAQNDSLLVGTTHTIAFSITGTSSEGVITLQYSTDSMATWNSIATISNQTSYNWLVPHTPSSRVFVRVMGTDGLVGLSKMFSILDSGRITITSPGTNASLLVGTTQTIDFSVSGYVDESSITLQYSTDNKSTWNPITTLSNQTTYDWLIPNTPSTTVFLRVRDANGAVGISQMFSILDSGKITITSPAKNDSLYVGTTYPIVFSATGYVDRSSITLQYSTDAMATWNTITTLSNQNSYSWLVPNTPSSRTIIRVMDDNGVVGLSQLFSIFDTATAPGVGRIVVTSPAANASLLVGTTQSIAFSVSGPVNEHSLSLQYSIDNKQTWNPITTLADQTSYNWVVPSTPSATAFVRVADDKGVVGMSGMFSIIDSGRVTNVMVSGAPNLAPGIPETISWNASGFLGETLDIDLFDPASGTYNAIVDGLAAGTRSYNWTTVPSTPQSGYIIRVTYASGAMGTSAPFSIAASGITPGTQPESISLAPNPFSTSSTLRFSLDANVDITLVIRDMLGREVMRIPEGLLSTGSHEIRLDGEKLPVGAYEYQVVGGSVSLIGNLTIMR